MKDDEIELLSESYVLKRLVYVNSANHGYSEIMLDKHMALFGDNNAGKTASLAGTKLLLFPEVNFHNCGKKFKFEGERGFFSKEESYDFYFPDAKSFIILEVMNPEGTFCMILYKRNNYAYGRFFIPLPYEKTRNLFWISQTETFADDLSIQVISKFVKSNHGIQLTDSKEIADLIFSSYTGEKSRKRFCILPLKDGRVASIAAFKNIYQLAFDIGNAETEALPEAIAALLEMGRSRDEERLDANLTQLSEEHSQLVKKQEWFQVLSNTQPLFKQVKSDYDHLVKDLNAYSIRFNSIEATIIKDKSDYLPLYENTKSDYDKADNVKVTLLNKLSSLNSHFEQEKAAIKELRKAYEYNKKEEEKTKQFIASFENKEIRIIIDTLENRLRKKESDLKKYKTENGIKKLLGENITEKNRLQKKLRKIRSFIKNSKSSVIHQLQNTNSSSVLFSLNEKFINLSVKLDSTHKATINDFTSLFDKNDANHLVFLGETIDIPFKRLDKQKQIDSWVNQEAIIKKQIDELDIDIEVQNNALKHTNIENLLEDTKQEVEKYSDEITLVSGLGRLTKNIKRQKQDIDDRELKSTSENLTINKLKNKQSKNSGLWNTLSQKLTTLESQQEGFKKIDSFLNLAKMQLRPLNCEPEKLDASELKIEMVEDVLKTASEYLKTFNQYKLQIQKLVAEIPHPSIDIHKDYIGISEYESLMQTYESSFSTLDYDLSQHRNEVSSHNQWVSNQLNELKDAKKLLLNFINAINKELNNKRISNLSKIKLHLEMHKRFESLLATLEKHDIQDDSLLKEEFYISLAKFVDEYFNKKTRRLKMHDIIQSINYHYTLKDTSDVVTKSQSGGTTSTITAFVLSVLLKQITPKYVSLRMPIIVDEVSTLDFKNAAATIMQISDHGFSIFCATPSYSSYISMKVGRWIMIDRAMVKTPLVKYCHMNILPEHIESFGEKASEA